MTRYLVIITLLGSFFLGSCRQQQQAVEQAQLGEIHIQVTGKPEAIPHFERGLLLLHSFEYEDARAAFVEARELDPDMMMAHWGEALTYNHPLWREQDFAAGREALERLGASAEERVARAQTDLERELLQAAEILYGEGDKVTRDKAYADYLGHLYEQYPTNHEVASLYALSLLGAVPVGRDEEAYERGAAIVRGILAENPRHPGALHYLIHSYDDPGHAYLALTAADSYAEVAPDAAHALHMPSHIYVALGMWDRVVSSNVASWEASVKRMLRNDLDNAARSYHAFHWLMYGYLQQGNQEEARTLMQRMDQYCREKPNISARSYLIEMKGNYLVETGDWQSAEAAITLDDRADLNISVRAIYDYLIGRNAHARGDQALLAQTIAKMEDARKRTTQLVGDTGIPMCSAGGANREVPNKLDLQQAEVLELELRGLLADLQGQKKEAERWLKAASEAEDLASYSYGPPPIVQPSRELYAEWLLANGRAAEAITQFDAAAKRGPNRRRVLLGLQQAAKAAGNKEREAEATMALQAIAQDAAEQTARLRPEGELL